GATIDRFVQDAAIATGEMHARGQTVRGETLGIARFGQFLRGENVTFSSNPVIDAQRRREARIMQRVLSQEDLELLMNPTLVGPDAARVRETYQRASTRAMRITERLRMFQNALANSMAFIFSSTAMAVFGAAMQEVQKVERGLKESRALANLSAQRDSGMDLWNRAQDVSSRLNQDVLEVLGAVRALREGGSRMSPQATLRLVESMGERVRAT